MATTLKPHQATAGSAGAPVAGAVHGAEGGAQAPRLASDQVWRALARASFAVLSHVTPAGAPRSSGVLYAVVARRLYVAVAPDSWKARHIAVSGRAGWPASRRRWRPWWRRTAPPRRACGAGWSA